MDVDMELALAMCTLSQACKVHTTVYPAAIVDASGSSEWFGGWQLMHLVNCSMHGHHDGTSTTPITSGHTTNLRSVFELLKGQDLHLETSLLSGQASHLQ